MKRTENLNLVDISPLTSPKKLKELIPVSKTAAETVIQARNSIKSILTGEDQRLLVIVGPCSIHDPEAAHDYALRLKKLAAEVSDTILIVMRVYFEKPRTTVGWKGLINDPELNGSHKVNEGIELARRILLEINNLGLPCATETLDPITPQYMADLISWSAIGARTTESQTHREMASGLSMPVGFKNGTDGGLNVALNAMNLLSTTIIFSESIMMVFPLSSKLQVIKMFTWFYVAETTDQITMRFQSTLLQMHLLQEACPKPS